MTRDDNPPPRLAKTREKTASPARAAAFQTGLSAESKASF